MYIHIKKASTFACLVKRASEKDAPHVITHKIQIYAFVCTKNKPISCGGPCLKETQSLALACNELVSAYNQFVSFHDELKSAHKELASVRDECTCAATGCASMLAPRSSLCRRFAYIHIRVQTHMYHFAGLYIRTYIHMSCTYIHTYICHVHIYIHTYIMCYGEFQR
jgi:hypothetical protein